MSLTPFSIPRFGGVNLRDDPQEVSSAGAIDLLNVDLDSDGRLRTRDGYDNFTSSAAAARYTGASYLTNTAGTRRIISSHRATTTISLEVINTSGTITSTQTLAAVPTDPYFLSTVCAGGAIGGTPAEVMFVTAGFVTPGAPVTGLAQLYYTNGTTWVAPGGSGDFYLLALQPIDNRLVGVQSSGADVREFSKVYFSDPEDPTSIASNFVRLTSGDGGIINALCTWQNLLFAFKTSSKFFVFFGNSVGATGVPVFNYRPVEKIGCDAWGGACAGLDGVYFISKRGIYRTTGGPAELVSQPLDPLFQGINALGISAINQQYLPLAKIAFHDDRIFVGVPTGSSTYNDTLLVYSPLYNYWTIWNIPVNGMCSAPMGSAFDSDLVFAYGTGSNHIGRQAPAFTTDDGTAIATRYQSGFYEPSPGMETTTRWTKLWGSGSPTVNIYTDHATSDPLGRGGAITLAVAPGVAKGYHLKSYQGTLFSHRLSSTEGRWSVNRIEHDMQFGFQPQ